MVARQGGHSCVMSRTPSTLVSDMNSSTLKITSGSRVTWLTHAISREILPCLILFPAPRTTGQFFNSIPPSLIGPLPLSLSHSPSLPISQYRLKSLCAAHTFVQSKHRRIEGANSNGYFLLLPQCLICSIMVHWGDIGSPRRFGETRNTYNKTHDP